ncbi:MAG: DUF4249 domain-containing protein [Flavobacteriales bacterium]
MRRLPFLLLLFLTASCTSEIDLDLDQKKKPSVVVEGFLTDSSNVAQWMRLTQTTGYYDKKKVPPVEGASVTVRGAGNTYTFHQNGDPDSASYYMAPAAFSLQQGKTYTLEVDHEDSTYRAKSKVKPVMGIDSVHLRLDPIQSISGGEIKDTTFQVVAHFDDLPAEGDHYLFNLYIDGELYSNEANEKNVIDDEGLDQNVELAVQSFKKSDIALGDSLTLSVRSVSQACDEFYAIFSDQTELSGNPFAAAPPANIPSNMSGTALGFFQVSSVNTHKRVFDAQMLSNTEIPEGGG